MLDAIVLETIVGVMGTALLGVIGWAVRLNSSVSVLETQDDSLRTLIDNQFAGVRREIRLEFDDVKGRLTRIEANTNGRQ